MFISDVVDGFQASIGSEPEDNNFIITISINKIVDEKSVILEILPYRHESDDKNSLIKVIKKAKDVTGRILQRRECIPVLDNLKAKVEHNDKKPKKR